MYGRNERQLWVSDIDQDSVLRPLHGSLRIIQLQFLTHYNIVVKKGFLVVVFVVCLDF